MQRNPLQEEIQEFCRVSIKCKDIVRDNKNLKKRANI